jgi:N-acetylated-alpha-linked acidic dipeptidase
VAQSDVLPLDYESYAAEIRREISQAERRAGQRFRKGAMDFSLLKEAAEGYLKAAKAITAALSDPKADAARLNSILLGAERSFLVQEGLPGRPWYKHAIYAPAEFSSYASTALPGINDAMTVGDVRLAQEQANVLTRTLVSAAALLRSYFVPGTQLAGTQVLGTQVPGR